MMFVVVDEDLLVLELTTEKSFSVTGTVATFIKANNSRYFQNSYHSMTLTTSVAYKTVIISSVITRKPSFAVPLISEIVIKFIAQIMFHALSQLFLFC